MSATSKCLHEGGQCSCTSVCTMQHIAPRKTRHGIKIDALTELVFESVGSKINLSVSLAGATVFQKAADLDKSIAIKNALQLCIEAAQKAHA